MPHPARSVLGVSRPLDGSISLRPRGHARSSAAPGVRSRATLSDGRAVMRCRIPAPLRLRCSTASNSEEYEVGSSADSKALEPIHPGSTAVVPESPSPLRSTSPRDRRGCFRLRSFPLALFPGTSGRTMTLRIGAPGSFTSHEASGSTRDPQLPWGSCCNPEDVLAPSGAPLRGHRHVHQSRKFSGARVPLRAFGSVSLAARPFRVTGLSKSHLLGQQSRRFRPA